MKVQHLSSKQRSQEVSIISKLFYAYASYFLPTNNGTEDRINLTECFKKRYESMIDEVIIYPKIMGLQWLKTVRI